MRIAAVVLLLLTAFLRLSQGPTAPYPGVPQNPLQLPVGWTLVQNNIQVTCTAGNSSCSWAACTGGTGSECFAPTVAGSVWINYVATGNNVTISSASGGGGTWSLCPSSSCHSFNSTLGLNSDLIYNLSGTAGTQIFQVNLSAPSSGFFSMVFAEVLPPPGYTASFDTGGGNADTSCTTTCNGVSLSLSSTDFVYECCTFNLNPWQAIGGHAWSSPYLTSLIGNGIGLNIHSGNTAPTIATVNGTGTGFLSSAIAFKSSAGAFNFTGSTNMSLVQYTLPTNSAAGSAAQVACNPNCTLTVPSTGSGNLLLLVEGDTGSNHRQISSVSGGGTWVVPTGANTCATNNTLSCAWVLSSTGAVTSVIVTLTGNTTTATAGFSWWELHRTSGSWTLDTQGAKVNTNTISPASPTITCTGTNDAVITAIGASGGVSTAQYMIFGNFPGAALNLETASPFEPSNGALLNTTNCGPFIFPFENGASLTANTFTVAFQ